MYWNILSANLLQVYIFFSRHQRVSAAWIIIKHQCTLSESLSQRIRKEIDISRRLLLSCFTMHVTAISRLSLFHYFLQKSVTGFNFARCWSYANFTRLTAGNCHERILCILKTLHHSILPLMLIRKTRTKFASQITFCVQTWQEGVQ